jgi:hypothetical protein
VLADETQWTGHKTCKRRNYFFSVPFTAPAVFFFGPLIILFKNISQPDRGKPDYGQILIVDLDIRFLIWREMFMSQAWWIEDEGTLQQFLSPSKKGHDIFFSMV